MSKEIQNLITSKINQAPQLVKNWNDYGNNPHKLKAMVKESLADEIERLDNDELANGYCQFVCDSGITVDNPERYKNQMINLPELGQAICGIRFSGMDLTKPFINVAITNEPLSVHGMSKAVIFLSELFADFLPKHIRFYIDADKNGKMPIVPEDFKQFDLTAMWDKVLIANQFSELNQPNLSDMNKNYCLERADNIDFYEDYKQAYADLFSQKPEFKLYTRCESYEDLQTILDNGFHFVLYDLTDGKQNFAGLFSLKWDCSNGLDGLYVVTKFIRTDLHGQGLGKQFESFVISSLLEQNLVLADTVFFGTIDFDNKASLRSAYVNGRIDLGSHLWVEC